MRYLYKVSLGCILMIFTASVDANDYMNGKSGNIDTAVLISGSAMVDLHNEISKNIEISNYWMRYTEMDAIGISIGMQRENEKNSVYALFKYAMLSGVYGFEIGPQVYPALNLKLRAWAGLTCIGVQSELNFGKNGGNALLGAFISMPLYFSNKNNRYH